MSSVASDDVHIKSLFKLLILPSVSFALAGALPLAVAVVDPCRSVAYAARTSGTDGQDGANGRSGADGRDGVSQTAEAGEQLIELDLQGTDGGDGDRGTRGSRARCRNHNRPSDDVKAASGGDGGDGGSGGNGGNGGSATVYYTDRAQLRNVSINAAGGRGGRGGSGADGGQGCNCHEYQWSETQCSSGTCVTKEFSCKDGEDGDDGHSGRRGKDGRIGSVRVIDQTLLEGDRLQADNPVVESAIAQLSSPIQLSRNLWQTQTGAHSLFNGGSVIDDSYQEYRGRVDRQFQLVWEADYPQTQASGDLSLFIDEGGNIQIVASDDIWLDAERTEDQRITNYRVQYALLASDAVDLSAGRSNGHGKQFSLNVIDLAGKSDIIETQFYVRYKTKREDRRGRLVTRYEGTLPSNLISRDYNRFALNIGQLPIDANYLRPDTQARLEITATRTLADNKAEQVIIWNGNL